MFALGRLDCAPPYARHYPPCIGYWQPCVRLDAALAASPYFVRHVSALYSPYICLSVPYNHLEFALTTPPVLIYIYPSYDHLVSAIFQLIFLEFALAIPPNLLRPGYGSYNFRICLNVRPPCARLGPIYALASGLYQFVACYGAGQWFHEV